MVQRRRHVLLGLATSLAVTLLLGLIPPLRMLWLLSGLSMMALVAYVALLARLQGLATEREQKLAYLPRPPDTRHLLHRSAN
ncbi:MAG TPA: hypothetical protein VE152_08670 [Acidimicrobiales bacterium]|nr:hypothetical protein [Acidimicrobiales bacterium]